MARAVFQQFQPYRAANAELVSRQAADDDLPDVGEALAPAKADAKMP